VLLLDLLQESFELLHVLHLRLYLLSLIFEFILLHLPVFDLALLFLDLFLFNLAQLVVLLPSHLMTLQESAELDQVILNQYILFSQLCLSLLKVLFLLRKLLLLILKRLLYLIHGTTLFEQTCSWRYRVKLQVLRQFDFLIHFNYINYNYACNQSVIQVSQGRDPTTLHIHSNSRDFNV